MGQMVTLIPRGATVMCCNGLAAQLDRTPDLGQVGLGIRENGTGDVTNDYV